MSDGTGPTVDGLIAEIGRAGWRYNLHTTDAGDGDDTVAVLGGESGHYASVTTNTAGTYACHEAKTPALALLGAYRAVRAALGEG